MIDLHRIDGTKILVNLDLIELIEETPDTVVTLTNEHKYVVKEKIPEIIEKIVDFKCSIHFKKLFIVDQDEQGNIPDGVKSQTALEPTIDIIKTPKGK